MNCIIIKSEDRLLQNYIINVKNVLLNTICKSEEVSILEGNISDLRKQLREVPADIIITFDLEGFEQSTLTDGISYNLLNSKFVNLLLHENLPNEKYLKKQLSISMFFYCVGDGYYQHLLNSYPELPYLKPLEGWQVAEGEESMTRNLECIMAAIEEVLRECHL